MSAAGSPEREVRELQVGETALAHAAMRVLRPGHSDRGGFVERVDDLLRREGYRLVAAFLPGRTEAVAVAGFRVGHSLAWGRYLYIDDLCVVPEARRQGHGRALLDWLGEEAKRLRCDQLHLDSGTGAERFDAHRLYHGRGYSIYSYHFAREAPRRSADWNLSKKRPMT